MGLGTLEKVAAELERPYPARRPASWGRRRSLAPYNRVAKRHNRARGYGLTVVAYGSQNRMGLISLDGTVVSRRANEPWRVKPNALGEGRR